MVSPELINEFIEIVREDYGVELTLEDASRIANNSVAYFDLLAKIHHQNQSQNLENPELPSA